jgi:hypothetical protein
VAKQSPDADSNSVTTYGACLGIPSPATIFGGHAIARAAFPSDGEGFGGGYGIPKHIDHLDAVCRELGLPLLSGFITVGDEGDPWFDPTDGLACVRGLLAWLAGAGSDDQRRMAADTVWGQIGALPPEQFGVVGPFVALGVAADLKTFEIVLAHAAERGTRFQLYLSC